MGKKDKSAQSEKPDVATGGREKSIKTQGKQDPAASVDKEPKRRDKPVESKAGMSDEAMLLISKALADPRRLLILRTIAKGSTSSCAEVQQHLPISAATLSHHMRELELAGLIETSRDGRYRQAKLQRKVLKSYLGELKAMVD